MRKSTLDIEVKTKEEIEEDEGKTIKFSLAYYSEQDKQFTINGIKKEGYLEKFISKLQHVCTLTRIRLPHETDEHTHRIKWKDTARPNGFQDAINEQLRDYEAWQISITQGVKQTGHGRIQGFFIGNVFYIVWFDPNHELYPRK